MSAFREPWQLKVAHGGSLGTRDCKSHSRIPDRVSCAPTSTTRTHGRLQLPFGTDFDHPRPCGDAGAAGLPRPDAGALAGARILASAGVGGVRPEPAPRRALDFPRFQPGAVADGAAVPAGGPGIARRGCRTRAGLARALLRAPPLVFLDAGAAGRRQLREGA